MSRSAHVDPGRDGLLIETHAGRIFHTGDCEIDRDFPCSRAVESRSARRVGDQACSPSCAHFNHVFQKSPSGSECRSARGLREEVARARREVVVTTCRLQCARLQTMAGSRMRRVGRLAWAGRSWTGSCVARRRPVPAGFPRHCRFRRSHALAPQRVLIMATGGRGEQRAALGRSRSAITTSSSRRRHGDLSSKIIPGNEAAIGRIMNALSDLGVISAPSGGPRSRVGHPAAAPILRTRHWIRPEIILRSTARSAYCRTCALCLVAWRPPRPLSSATATWSVWSPGAPGKFDEVRVGRLVLDGDVILPADGTTITERRRWGTSG